MFKTIIPIGTFILLALLTLNSNLLNIFVKRAESDPKANESVNRIVDTSEKMFGFPYEILISIAYFTFGIAVINLICSNLRKSRIKLHLDVIKKVKENEKKSESEKENKSN
ncbi:hypothetical protein [Paenibacillus tyrfis]|uniref:hypothetical protein n=1 Tax=Paenibacillus tyrfis TaxID=1501230 RepID=UPI000B5933D6|nr:hypothetical protein [Paenibacillus tyrfis]